jgi:hypothetical protein
MRFVLLVEGPTEKALARFLKRWLDAHLDPKIGVQTSKPGGGCCRLVEDMSQKARIYLSHPKANELIGVVALLDLHGLAHPSNVVSSPERVSWWTNKIENEVDDPRFRVFFAVHDVEAWLLSQPEIFPRKVQAELGGDIRDPESVDFDEPPGKLLQRIYRKVTDREYKKVTHGTELFGKLDPDVACSKCRQLKRMLDHMLQEAVVRAGCRRL